MAIKNFIPTIWSENLYKALDKQYIAVSNCNRDYEGDIKNMGSVVKICGVGNVVIEDYTKNTDMNNHQALSDTVAELKIDQAKYFNFQIDDIDRAQSTPKLMDAAMSVAASGLANAADAYVFSLYNESGFTLSIDEPEPQDIINLIIDARKKLYQKNVSDSSEVVVEVSPEIASLILKAKMTLSTDNTASFENGYIGSVVGCKIYVSNNVVTIPDDSGNYTEHKCFVRTKRAIAFAEQLSEINAYRPEKRFADAVKGLHLYGASVIYPEEFAVLNINTLG